MTIAQSLPWIHPLDAAATISDPYWVLLYSGMQTSYSGRYSYLARELIDTIKANNFDAFAARLTHNTSPFENCWFGYLGYGLKDSLEKLTADQPNWFALPPLYMMQFSTIYQFDHHARTLTAYSNQPAIIPLGTEKKGILPTPHITTLNSNMTTPEYLEKVAYVLERIHAGDLYQANLTRKFYGAFENTPDAFSIFHTLCTISPAPYSAFLSMGKTFVISSSPEQFLSIDASGNVSSRPIKGTASRSEDAEQDMKLCAQLANSEKDRAENLMIVDLMRNDIARSCAPGSVTVDSLFDVTTHATIHHMSSTIRGCKRPDQSVLDIVKHCFPPGSMTGAPKIKAMNLCSQLERVERGIYSGAIGWFGGDGSAELSVVIRTLLLNGNRFEFQVGGGVVADSTPVQEWQELLAKAKGIGKTLGLDAARLEAA